MRRAIDRLAVAAAPRYRALIQAMPQRVRRILRKSGPIAAMHSRLKTVLYPSDVVTISVRGHRLIVDPRDAGMGPSLIFDRGYEQFETALFESCIEPGMTVLDLGANIGYYTLVAARQCQSAGTVVSFEPDPLNREILERNVALNRYSNVRVVSAAVSSESGHATIYRDSTYSSCSSLEPRNVLISAGAVSVETVSLDRFWRDELNRGRIDVMKVDIQGAEGLLVAGGRETLRANRPIMFMELWPHGLRSMGTDPLNLLDELSGLGYRVERIHEDGQTVAPADAEELVTACDVVLGGRGHIDLLLRPTRGHSLRIDTHR